MTSPYRAYCDCLKALRARHPVLPTDEQRRRLLELWHASHADVQRFWARPDSGDLCGVPGTPRETLEELEVEFPIAAPEPEPLEPEPELEPERAPLEEAVVRWRELMVDAREHVATSEGKPKVKGMAQGQPSIRKMMKTHKAGQPLVLKAIAAVRAANNR